MLIISWLIATFIAIAQAQIAKVNLYLTAQHGRGAAVGSVSFEDINLHTDHGVVSGLLIMPQLHGLPVGEHGFHIHQYPDCDDSGLAAGGHLDPQKTDQHSGPYHDDGHLGDLPLLFVNADGQALTPIFAPRLRVSDIIDRSVIIHQHGDNYADSPQLLGGGGKRIACGVITRADIVRANSLIELTKNKKLHH